MGFVGGCNDGYGMNMPGGDNGDKKVEVSASVSRAVCLAAEIGQRTACASGRKRGAGACEPSGPDRDATRRNPANDRARACRALSEPVQPASNPELRSRLPWTITRRPGKTVEVSFLNSGRSGCFDCAWSVVCGERRRASAYDVAKEKIDGEISSTTQVGQNPNQPNEDFIQSLKIRTSATWTAKAIKRKKGTSRAATKALPATWAAPPTGFSRIRAKAIRCPNFRRQGRAGGFRDSSRRCGTTASKTSKRRPRTRTRGPRAGPEIWDRYRDRIKEHIFPPLRHDEMRTTRKTPIRSQAGAAWAARRRAGLHKTAARQSRPGRRRSARRQDPRDRFHNWTTAFTLDIMVAQEDLGLRGPVEGHRDP